MEYISEFIDRLHHASWSSIIGLFCSLGILITMIGMIIVLCMMWRELGQMVKEDRDRAKERKSRGTSQ